MELRQLQTFRLIAQTLSFTRTAETLNYAQSSVSSQIQELETEFGTALFERLGRKVALTDSGTRLLQYADKILALAEDAHSAVANQAEPMGTLTITAPETLCTYRLPAVLDRFRQQFPRVQLIFRPLDNLFASWERQLMEGIADAALILSEPMQAPKFVLESLLSERILVVAHPAHPLAQCHTVDHTVELAALRSETMLLTEAGCGYRVIFDRALQQAGVRLNTVMEFHSVEAIKQCTMSGLGVAVLPEIAVRSEIDQGRLAIVPCAGQPITMLTVLAWHKDKWLSPALRAFLQVTRETLYKE
jgi:DNA-binding transcriptional LysR family regulator